jgi:hypothetical protein
MSLKQLIEKSVAQQRQVISEINTLVKDIERCEKTITDLKSELETVNQKHKDRTTTREDIDYLTDLLKCANKKLTWEKHMASLQKRTPVILEKMSRILNDPKIPPADDAQRVAGCSGRDGTIANGEGKLNPSQVTASAVDKNGADGLWHSSQ